MERSSKIKEEGITAEGHFLRPLTAGKTPTKSIWKGKKWDGVCNEKGSPVTPPTTPTPHLHQFLKWNLFHWKNAFYHIISSRGRRQWRSDGSISVCSGAAGRAKTNCIFYNWVDADTNPLTFAFPGLLLSCSVGFSWSVQNSVVKVKLKATCYAVCFSYYTDRNTKVFTFIRARQASTDKEWANQQFPVCPVCL